MGVGRGPPTISVAIVRKDSLRFPSPSTFVPTSLGSIYLAVDAPPHVAGREATSSVVSHLHVGMAAGNPTGGTVHKLGRLVRKQNSDRIRSTKRSMDPNLVTS